MACLLLASQAPAFPPTIGAGSRAAGLLPLFGFISAMNNDSTVFAYCDTDVAAVYQSREILAGKRRHS